MWNLWVWEGSWRVLASYERASEAYNALNAQDAPAGGASVARVGSVKDGRIRANVTDKEAPWS